MNFFKIARKEIDQDNFIRWLLASYSSTDDTERNASFAFIRHLINVPDAQIVMVNIYYQPYLNKDARPDFIVGIKTEDKGYLVLLEDKIDAPIKNDLSNYKSKFIEQANSFCSKFGFDLSNTTLIYLILKTGTILDNDYKYANEYGFRLINADNVVNLLTEFSKHYLIKSFVAKISVDEHELLNAFSRHKNKLFGWLAQKFDKSFTFNAQNQSANFNFNFNEKKCYINVYIASLVSGKIKVRLFSDNKLDTKCLSNWEIVKESKMNPPLKGKADLDLGNCEIIYLYNCLKTLFDSVKLCVNE